MERHKFRRKLASLMSEYNVDRFAYNDETGNMEFVVDTVYFTLFEGDEGTPDDIVEQTGGY